MQRGVHDCIGNDVVHPLRRMDGVEEDVLVCVCAQKRGAQAAKVAGLEKTCPAASLHSVLETSNFPRCFFLSRELRNPLPILLTAPPFLLTPSSQRQPHLPIPNAGAASPHPKPRRCRLPEPSSPPASVVTVAPASTVAGACLYGVIPTSIGWRCKLRHQLDGTRRAPDRR